LRARRIFDAYGKIIKHAKGCVEIVNVHEGAIVELAPARCIWKSACIR
jgi:hypothetical protein